MWTWKSIEVYVKSKTCCLAGEQVYLGGQWALRPATDRHELRGQGEPRVVFQQVKDRIREARMVVILKVE